MSSEEERERSTPRDADNSRSNTPDSGSNDVAGLPDPGFSIEERLAGKMFTYGREIVCFFLAITFTALAALHSSPPRISKPPPAKPFFNQSSVVLDFYEGHLGAMIQRVTVAEFSFVMYYAPWDAESQMVREEFEKVAQYYQSRIFFAAINCWHPNSECRTQYNKIQSYPVLMLYPSRDSGVQYKGIRTAPYMIQFLNELMNPIVRITHKDQLMKLLVNHDAVIVGYFNFTRLDRTPGYKAFYTAALSSLEKDFNRELVFAVVTSTFSSEMNYGVVRFPSATLLLWNESLSYPEDSEWTSENILNWVSSSIHQPTLWLQPPGIKSLTLAPYLKEGPVLFLFTPRNPLHTENYNYNLLREVGLQYYNCQDNVLVNEIIRHLETNRHSAVRRHSEKTKQCIELMNENKAESGEPIVSMSIQQWINDSCCANIVMNKCLLCKKKIVNLVEKEMAVCTLDSEKFDYGCKSVDIFKFSTIGDEREKYEFCCEKGRVTVNLHEKPKSKSDENDPRSPNVLKQAFTKEDCRKWLTGNKYHHPVFPRDTSKQPNINLIESVCKVNRTLVLIAIDSLHYFHFAEALGIDVLKHRDKTAVIILDAAHESQYIMQHDFSRYALIQFINNYTEGSLRRTLRSDNTRRFAQKFKTKVKCSERKTMSEICIPELTTETFLSTILDPTKDVVVMYHSPYCAFCTAISYVYLTVAHYLTEMDHLLFVRVDGDNNDLPWEYSMNRFPSILFFPAKRKEDSTVFPFSLPITIPNLLNFILANLDGDSHVEALTNVCKSGAGEPPDKCIARIRWLCLDIIEELLRDYRKLRRHLGFLNKRTARNKRKIILLKLEHIRDIHLILDSTVNLYEDKCKAQLIQKKFRKYYRVLKSVELDSRTSTNQANSTSSKQKHSFRSKTPVKSEL